MATFNHQYDMICSARLLEAYNKMKKRPDKVFITSDFKPLKPNKFRERYLSLLKKLELIEEVEVIYTTGYKSKCRRSVYGYRIKDRNNNKGGQLN